MDAGVPVTVTKRNVPSILSIKATNSERNKVAAAESQAAAAQGAAQHQAGRGRDRDTGRRGQGDHRC
jgi:antitoxin (DNA-binding transcriptional repressor) of toxin-antitoxin stability system